jgi:hypothetical protein
MSYFDELDKGHEQTKTSKDWAIFRKGLEKTLFKCILVCSNCHAIEHWEKHHPGEGRYGSIKT